MGDPIFTASELLDVQAYHAPLYVLTAVDLVLSPLLMGLAASVLCVPMYRLAERLTSRWRSAVMTRVWGGPGWGATIVFALLLFGGLTLLWLPVDVWFGYVREKRFGLSTSSWGTFLVDSLKGHGLTALAVVALAFGLFGLARRLRQWWWVMAVVASVVMMASAALDPYRSRVYVDQMPLAEGPLRERIFSLMEKAGVEVADVRVDKTLSRTVRLQAYFAGAGPTRTIVLNDALLEKLTDDEIVAAVAHEAGHVHESRWLARVLSTMALFAFLGLVEWLFRRSARRGWYGITERADVRVLPLIILLFDLSMTAAAPASGYVSREREWAADRYGMTLTGDSAAFASMLVKAARVNKMDPTPPRWVVWSGRTHPPIGERVDFARGFGR